MVAGHEPTEGAVRAPFSLEGECRRRSVLEVNEDGQLFCHVVTSTTNNPVKK
ncbi:MAG: hypothetical protein AB7R89_16190 [Dehalococcoidia bacterium]